MTDARPARRRRRARPPAATRNRGAEAAERRWRDFVAPAGPQPVSNTASIAVNGTEHEVSPGGSFPEDDPIFRLTSLKKGTARVGIVGGGYANGAPTITLEKGGKPVTLMNTADGTTYVLRYVGSAKGLRAAADRAVGGSDYARSQGFGLIELLMAMVILNIGILAIVASFNAGIITLNRASRITTAAVLADQQMELFRAIEYESIRLAPATIPATAPYTTDPAYNATQITAPSCGAGPSYPNECTATRQATGADGKLYRVNTYIVEATPVNGRALKQVTIVVRDDADQARVFVRQASSFDQSTG